MASSIPSQTRTVDPFASYNSDTVNKLTRMLTYGEDGLAITRSCDISLDATSATKVNMSTGVVYKDDMWIEITSQHIVDFDDSDHYYDFDTGFDEVGYYYIVLSYTFQKQRPAPQAEVLIIKPSQRNLYSAGGDWLFLKAVHVSWNGLEFVTDGTSSFDPDTPANKRLFIRSYAGTEITLPTFTASRDTSRLLYVTSEDDLYIGLANSWSILGTSASVIEANTTGFAEGDLVYITAAGTVAAAIASIDISTADGVVSKVGTNGRIRTAGQVTTVPVEIGASVTTGTLVYLSQTQPGAVTDTITTPYHQFVGRCTSIIDATSVNMLFVRGEPMSEDAIQYAAVISDTLQPPNWVWSGGLYYQDINISTIEGISAAVTVWDSTSNLKIEPESIEFLNLSTVRIWMVSNSLTINVLLIGPAATPASAVNTLALYESLPSGSWLGVGPYYQDVDVSSITSQDSLVLVRDTATDRVIYPTEVEYDSTSNLRIWMNVNTEDLEVSVIGPTAISQTVSSLGTIMPSGPSWISSGGLYYQDISLASFGDNHVIFEFVDNNTNNVIRPAAIDFIFPTVARIWMVNDTLQLNVTIIG